MRAELAGRQLHSLDRFVSELESARHLAMTMDKPQPKAAVDAILAKAKILGLDKIADKPEALDGLPDVASASEDQLAALETALAAFAPEMANAPPPGRRH